MIELPFPHKLLWPNGSRGNHFAVSGQKKKHRKWAHDATRAVLPTCFAYNGAPLRPTITVNPKPRGRAPDRDNIIAAFKAYQDGIASALGVDDSTFLEPRVIIGERCQHGRFVVDFGE